MKFIKENLETLGDDSSLHLSNFDKFSHLCGNELTKIETYMLLCKAEVVRLFLLNYLARKAYKPGSVGQ